jgi:hypothetical protein
VHNIAEKIFSHAGVIAFANAIGFADEPCDLPAEAGRFVQHLGQRGTLRCLHVRVSDFDATDLSRVAGQLRREFGAELLLFIFAQADYARVCVAAFGAEELCTLFLERGRVRPADVDALTEMVPANGESGLQLAMRHARALDRMRVTHRFFEDFRSQRAAVAEAWQGIAPRFREEREQLALLLLSRLMFLYFLQRRGFLNRDQDFFAHALRRHFAQPRTCSFYRGVLRPLFFGVLNRRPEKRTARAAALGRLPYLNGGLFERHSLERRFPQLDLADAVIRGVFELLLERYRFTATERAHDLAVDPEMLGRVFEGLMAETTRHDTGTFYTPAPVVTRMVRSAFDAHLAQYPMQCTSRLLREVRVLDPACGSGAFLLGALAYIAERRALLDGDDGASIRRDVVARNLHGVDVQPDAALLCALRLWLALIPDSCEAAIQPLPNLDRRVRQGDALIDPLDLAAEAVASADVRAARKELQPLVLRYTTCDPEERPGIQRLVARRERRLSRAWLEALQLRMKHATSELTAEARARDLFGDVPASALTARAQLRDLATRTAELKRLHHKLREEGALPFFSFNVHFADAEKSGFDIVLCNPPWVRSHNWPKHLASGTRHRFAVCRDGGQVDLALLFLERAISLLAPGGTLAIILPAKFLRSASAGAARELLLQRMNVLSIEDHSLDQRSIFGADAFTAIVLAQRKSEAAAPAAAVTMIRRNCAPLVFQTRRELLSFDAHNARSIWLLAPAAVRSALSQMQNAGQPVAPQLQIRRGAITGANAAMIITESIPKLGDLAWIRSEGGFEAHVESSSLRPLVRGADIHAWRFDARHQVIFCHDDVSGNYSLPPRRLARYLKEHEVRDAKGRFGALQHVSARPTTRLAWHDLANTLKAVVLPGAAPCHGQPRPLVPLNTVYFIALPDEEAHLLAAYFNSLPVRVFARAIAERAKDAHFRFFACTIGMLPLPACWRSVHADELRRLSRSAHAAGHIDEDAQKSLDELIGAAYGLTASAIHALRRFDRWLRGEHDDSA